MTNQHPIIPPKELVWQWSIEAEDEHQPTVAYSMVSLLTAKAAQWGANQELEACCREVQTLYSGGSRLRARRRPQPPSLKEQALAALIAIATGANDIREQHQDFDTIRAALEALPND